MLTARIYKEEWSVNARLAEVFGVTREELIQVVREVVGARADAVENDPVTAAGLFAYIHGVRNLRALLRPKGYLLSRKDNIELVKHPNRPLMVAYQSVDLAASDGHSPKAISGKGFGAERVIDEAQMSLFSILESEQHAQNPAPINTGLWHLCVSVVGDQRPDVRAEISLSSGISGGNFKAPFIERIYIVQKGEWDNIGVKNDPLHDAVDFEPLVRRK